MEWKSCSSQQEVTRDLAVGIERFMCAFETSSRGEGPGFDTLWKLVTESNFGKCDLHSGGNQLCLHGDVTNRTLRL